MNSATPPNDARSNEELVDARRQEAKQGGGAARIETQHARGKLTARERVTLLVDEGSFEEIDALVEHRTTDFGMAEKRFPGDGVVTGHGTVAGRRVFLFSRRPLRRWPRARAAPAGARCSVSRLDLLRTFAAARLKRG